MPSKDFVGYLSIDFYSVYAANTHKSLPNAVKSMLKAGKNLRLPVDFRMADLYARCLQITLEKELKNADDV